MRHFMKSVRRLIFITSVLLIPVIISAQSSDAYENAKKEITQHFGSFLSMFEAYPADALPGAWENFKQMQRPNSAIPPKYRELTQLAVASQIPCVYCVYYHTVVAKAYGATDEEIKEAVAYGAQSRQWSMILQGNQIEYEDFKKEVDAALKYMSEQSGN
jgi:AhpD family alkylhydroperoxidase